MENDFSNIEDYYKDLIIKVLSGMALPESVDILKKWLEQSPENRAYFKHMSGTWRICSTILPAKRYNTEIAWQKAQPRIKAKKSASTIQTINIPKLVRYAAILVLTFLIGGLTTYIGLKSVQKRSDNIQSSINEVMAPMGSKSQVTLPDGTIVWLNAGSKLHYSQAYNDRDRNVFLEGEAYFKVATNPRKPFVVNAKNINVKAFGTEFNVKAYPDENIVETTLVHGIVKIEGDDKLTGHFTIDMKPNQKITCFTGKDTSYKQIKNVQAVLNSNKDETIKETTGSTMVMDNVETDLYTSWKDNRWIFKGERIGDLAIILEREFNVRITFDSEKLKEYRFTGTFQNETIEQVMQVLKLTAPLVYKIGKGEVTIGLNQGIQTQYDKYIN